MMRAIAARWWLWVLLLGAALLLVMCTRGGSNAEPVRVASNVAIPAQSSSIAVPVTARLDDLATVLNSRLPQSFDSSEAQREACAAASGVRRIGCQFVGSVTRGPVRVEQVEGDVIKVTLPLAGTVDARTMSRLAGTQPVSARAEIEALLRLEMVGDWQPELGVKLAYRWVDPPGITAFGRWISLEAAADPFVEKLIPQFEAAVPVWLERQQPRARLEGVWKQGFTVLPINPDAPPVWLRLTPKALHFNNYTIVDGVLNLSLGATAVTETFIGSRPTDPVAVPLPPPAPLPASGLGRFSVHVPVVADYAGLEKLVAAALKDVETPAIQVRGIGAVETSFGDVSIHETSDGRLAIGLTMSAATQRQWLRPRGTVWMTAKVSNAPGSQRLDVSDVQVTGDADSTSFGVLLGVARSRVVRNQIARALSRDFAAEYERALAGARATLADRQVGDFKLVVSLDEVTNGALVPTAQGLYLPVEAHGRAELRLSPVVK